MLIGVALFCIAVCSLTIYAATRGPWLGLTFSVTEGGEVRVLTSRGPTAAVEVGASDLVLHAGGRSSAITALDLIEDPDYFDSYDEVDAFYVRQAELYRVLHGDSLTLHYRDPRGQARALAIEPADRPLGDLPPVFWFQLFVGASGLLLSTWAFVASPRNFAARCLGVMGLTFFAFTCPAAHYSCRELALDASVFRALSVINHVGAIAFGGAMVFLFLGYPRRLLGTRGLTFVASLVAFWSVLDVTHALNPDLGYRVPVLVEQLSAIVLSGVQWRRTKGDAPARAELRWFSLSVLFGAGMFVFCTAGVSMLGLTPPFSQGYGFGFFSLMYVGLALGLRRHQMLGLDEWAYRVLLWLLGAVLLVVVDLCLVLWLGAHSALSLTTSLLICGFLYLPLRNWLWARMVSSQRVVGPELFESVLDAAFAPSPAQRERLWRGLLEELFEPAELEPTPHLSEAVVISEQGTRMTLPSFSGLPALALQFPWHGRGLFELRHLRLAESLVRLMQRAELARVAYVSGVRDERQRIARDLHDNLGARLLTGLFAEDVSETRQEIRVAISEMRSIVHDLVGEDAPSQTLSSLLATMRQEASERLRATELALSWTSTDLSREVALEPVFVRHYTSVMRELLSNVLRHASARSVHVEVRVEGAELLTSVRDDGIGLSAEHQAAKEGHGLAGIRARVRELRGSVQFAGDRGTEVRIRLPLAFTGQEAKAPLLEGMP